MRTTIPSTDTPTVAHGDQVFVRQATGLVREASALDAALFNLMWSSIPLAVALILLTGPALYTRSNLAIAILLAALLAVPMALTYAFLASAMPRSGADYVWVSRLVHPALGFMSNVSFNFWVTFFIGEYATLLGSWGLSSVFRVLAAYTGTRGFLSAADFFVTTGGVLILGFALVILSTALLIFGRGIETFLRLQRWAFILWLVGGILVPGVVILFASPAAFAHHFDTYVASLGGHADAHAAVIRGGGFSDRPASPGLTILAVTMPYFVMGFIFQSAYFGGEIKRGKGTHVLSMGGALVLAVLLLEFVVVGFDRGVGRGFLGALGLAAPAQYGLGFTPLYAELAGIAANNIVVGLLVTVGFTVGFIFWVPQTMVLISRGLFAWSLDRLLPEKVSEVNPRTHTPVVSTLIIMVGGLIAVTVVAFNPSLSAVVGLFGLTLTYLCVSLGAVLFPYRHPDVFAASPYNQRIGGIPLVSVVGAVSFVAAAALEAILLLDRNSGTSWALNRGTVLLALGVFCGALPVYYIARALQRRQGFDVDLAYKEIPPD